MVAQTPAFFIVSMIMVVFNAIFVALDVDYNDATVITKAEAQFAISEYTFTVFFSVEITIRFMAFKKTKACLKDRWFVFDALLVVLMLLENVAYPVVLLLINNDDPPNLGSSLSVLRVLRLLRLTKVFRAVPQLLTLVKGITAALVSMLFTLVLLAILLFVFGVVFASQMKAASCDMPDEVKVQNSVDRCAQIFTLFGSVGESSKSLLLYGTFLDSPAMVATLFWDNKQAYLAWVFLLFIFLSSFTVLNMLIGIVCEVVSSVDKKEKEEEQARFLKINLLNILECYDKDDDESIGPDEFKTFFSNPEVQNLLSRFGTKVGGILSLKDVLFEDTDKLTFPELLETIMRLRGDNKAEVTDIMELREFIRQCNEQTKASVANLRKIISGEPTDPKYLERTDSVAYSAALPLTREATNKGPLGGSYHLAPDTPGAAAAPVRGPAVLTEISSPMACGADDTTDAASWEALSERIGRIESMCLARQESEQELRDRLGHLEQVLQRLADQFGGAEADIS